MFLSGLCLRESSGLRYGPGRPSGRSKSHPGACIRRGRLCPKACIWVHPSAEKVLRKSRELEANWSR